MTKESFMLFNQHYQSIAGLSNNQKASLLDAIYFAGGAHDKMPDLDPVTMMAFNFISASIKTMNERWMMQAETNRKNGAKGGRPSKNKNLDIKPKKANGFEKSERLKNNQPVSEKPKKAKKANLTLKERYRLGLGLGLEKEISYSNEYSCSSADAAEAITIKKSDEFAEGFEAFYAAYPRKVGKQAALKAWIRARKEKRITIPDAVIEALERHKASTAWRDVLYVPYPATWLNGSRWNDELIETEREKYPWEQGYVHR